MKDLGLYHLGAGSKISDNHFYSYVATYNDDREYISTSVYAKLIDTSPQNINALATRLIKNGWLASTTEGLIALKRNEADALTEEFNKARKSL